MKCLAEITESLLLKYCLAKKYDGQCWTAETDCVDKKRIRAFWFDRKEDINSFCSDVKKKFGNKVVFAEIHDLNDDD